MRVAVHQPIFVPWLGLFHKVGQVDRFVFMDHVQAPRGKSWISRNRIPLGGEVSWLTIPIERSGKSIQPIDGIRINYGSPFVRKHLGTLTQVYRRCPYFGETFALLTDLYGRHHEYLNDFNIAFAQEVSDRLGLTTKFVRSRKLVQAEPSLAGLVGNDLVLRLCGAAGATAYVSGMGCLDFIQPQSFEDAGVEFYFQDFQHPTYPQASRGPFVSHLSVLDVLFNVGFAGTRALIREEMLFRFGERDVPFPVAGEG